MTPSLITSLGFRRVACISPVVHVGDVERNVDDILDRCSIAEEQGAEIIVLPELCITGYSIGDLVRFPDLLTAALNGLDRVRDWSTGRKPLTVVGLPIEHGSRLYNCAAVIHDAHVHAIIPKTYLPSTNEFYEHRWYVSGADATSDMIVINGREVPFGTDILIRDAQDASCMIGVEICEDLWAVEPPSGAMARSGASLILNLSASNELAGKKEYRQALVRMQSARTITAYAYASSGPTESTTDTVYSGHCIIAESWDLLAESHRLQLNGAEIIADVDLRRCLTDRLHTNSFTELPPSRTFRVIELLMERSIKNDVRRAIDPQPFVPSPGPDRSDRCAEIIRLQAMGLAVRMRHTGSQRLVVGVSGGLDSTLALMVCQEACDILDRDHSTILGVSMPGFGTTARTKSNAEQLVEAMGAELKLIPIDESVRLHFRDIGHDESDHSAVFENSQARERTQILMDIANQVGGMVVGTGDMSELALGWSTYNGDHMSMYGVNAGVPKTLVRHLIEFYAEERATSATKKLLLDILATPISPELLPPIASGEVGQRTEDVLGPYEVHDFFLYHFVRMERPVRTISTLAMLAFKDRYTPSQILNWFGIFLRRFFSQQFKRSCLPDGVKIGSVALSPRADWRMPSDAHPSIWLKELEDVKRNVE